MKCSSLAIAVVNWIVTAQQVGEPQDQDGRDHVHQNDGEIVDAEQDVGGRINRRRANRPIGARLVRFEPIDAMQRHVARKDVIGLRVGDRVHLDQRDPNVLLN